jgi:hypothetical protein
LRKKEINNYERMFFDKQ